MAVTAQGAELTQAHMRAQQGLRAAVIRDIIKLYPMWDPFKVDSLDLFSAAVVALAQKRAVDSGALAAGYFELFREVDAGLTWGKAAAIAEPPTMGEVRAAINATMVSGFWTGLGNGLTTEQARQVALSRLTGGVTRVISNGGRTTLVDAIGSDNYYHGWMRVSDGKPCAFCAMLLGRGPVYWTKDSAGGSTHWHDNCGCHAEPYAEGMPWPEANQKYHDLWNATANQGESHPLNNFRRALSKGEAPAG